VRVDYVLLKLNQDSPVPDSTSSRLDEDVELLNTIEGTVPAPDAMPAGCRFAPRCPYGKDRCMKEKPGVYHAGNSLVSCFRYEGEKE
ncbi:MAG: oligopeptide/dipeptide ABC transporter ATP-binding protein, partial [Blautia faecis]